MPINVNPTAAAVNTLNSSVGTTATDRSQVSTQDFFNLLLTQLRHQNPLEPMSDMDFISQMAQFNMLEQLTTVRQELVGLRQDLTEELARLNENLENYFGNSDQSSPGVAALNLLGEKIKAQVDGNVIEGIVRSVKDFASNPILVLDDYEVELGDVLEVVR